jgi:hypothetical protein
VTPKGIVLPSVLVLIAAAGLAARQLAGGPEHILMTAGSEGLSGPALAGSGYVKLGLHNATDSTMAYELVRLAEGIAPAEGMRALRVMRHLERGDTAVARAKLDGFYGGPVYVGPGETKWVATTVPRGSYVSYAEAIAEQGPPVLQPGYLAPLTVRSAPEDAERPSPDHELTMVDFSFQTPRTVKPGPALWRISNLGQAPHLAFFAKLRPGKTVDDLKADFAARPPRPPRTLDPEVEIVGVHALTNGMYNDVELDLSEGSWVIGCVIDGHHVLGMLRPLEVTR